MKKKKKKTLKGMTLVEVLVALVIFTIMSSLLAGSVAMVCGVYKKTDRVVNKMSREVPVAEKQDKDRSSNIKSGKLAIEIEGAKGNVPYDEYKVDDSENAIADFKFIKPTEPVT